MKHDGGPAFPVSWGGIRLDGRWARHDPTRRRIRKWESHGEETVGIITRLEEFLDDVQSERGIGEE